MMKKIITILSLVLTIFLVSGCEIKRDSLENVDIYTTVYPIEYIVNQLYGYNSRVSSIYPAEVNLNEYSLTKKQLDTYSKGAVFVYNGLSNEKAIARDLLNKNTNLKIIDVSQGLEYENSVEELWLNPRDYLMMAHNVKNGLEEYITNKYIIGEINKNYEDLKLLISSFDAELELIPDNAQNKTIITTSKTLSFLEKYGFEVVYVTKDSPSTVVTKAKRLLKEKKVSYLYMLDSETEDEVTEDLKKAGASVIKLRSMTVKKESDAIDGVTYKHMMRETIDALKKEVYD